MLVEHLLILYGLKEYVVAVVELWFKRSGVRNGSGSHTQLWNLSSDNDSTKYIEIAI